ncbi:hypothetical protein ABW21_db0208933 [Orbilia brochopaga]|nr:hypothetical protein ABW21_db0208933 [Drechslerella brochopaga]
MAALQRPRLANIDRPLIEGLPSFRLKSKAIENGQFKIKSPGKETISEPNPEDPTIINADIWFKSPALDAATIRRIHGIQLYAESHDQGFCDTPDAGNWTWFELGIYEDDQAEFPRVKDGISLVWRSHYNFFDSDEYGWCEGDKFDGNHDLIRCLEDGNVIGVRLCTRFQGWQIFARNGYLVLDIGSETRDRTPPNFGSIVDTITDIQQVIKEVNVQNQSVFMPSIPNNLFTAENVANRHERPLRVLSLDGGGVRGLMSLELLREIFKDAGITKKPCEVFDMIGGTSTGGLIAIMLGRLQMSIDECIKKYLDVMDKVFPDKSSLSKNVSLGYSGETYDEKPLQDAIKMIVKERLGDSEAKLLDTEGKNPCKIFVMAVREDKSNNRGPVFLRSYPSENEVPEFPDIKVWEAARATSAAPSYFKAMSLGKYKLVDGGLGANNPLGWLWTEMLGVFGPARHTACFLSIGTGMQPNAGLPDVRNVLAAEKAFASVATNTEIVHVLFRTLINAFAPRPQGKKYWRLNIGKSLGDWDEKEKGVLTWITRPKTVHHYDDYKTIGEMDDVKALKQLRIMMEEYISDNKTLFTECAATIAESLKDE